MVSQLTKLRTLEPKRYKAEVRHLLPNRARCPTPAGEAEPDATMVMDPWSVRNHELTERRPRMATRCHVRHHELTERLPRMPTRRHRVRHLAPLRW